MKGIWISWERHRRNIGISNALGFELFEIIIEENRLWRYICSSLKTVSIIIKEKPDIVVSQNPSIVLSLLVVFLKKLLGYKAIVDAHNSGIFPLEGKYRFLNLLSKIVQKKADITIVTNKELKNIVEKNGGKGFVLPDKIPKVCEKLEKLPLEDGFNIVYICSWVEDEPFDEVIKAAYLIPTNIFLYFTGNYKGKVQKYSLPENVRLLGYISEKHYWNLLFSSDAIMDLTKRENCLVCGAYEGIALLKPLILSDTKVQKDLFNKGCIYVKPEAISIAKEIKELVQNYNKLKEEIVELKESYEKIWDRSLEIIKREIYV